MIDQKPLENVEYYKCLCNIVTNVTRCTHEIISNFAVTKSAVNRKKALPSNKLDLN
jgi:hypothetical protein